MKQKVKTVTWSALHVLYSDQNGMSVADHSVALSCTDFDPLTIDGITTWWGLPSKKFLKRRTAAGSVRSERIIADIDTVVPAGITTLVCW
jgi:hypothetical protein